MLIIGGSETFPKTLANGVWRLWDARRHGVLFLYASANRDEREFRNPDDFDTASAPAHAETLLSRMPDYEVDLERAERLRTEFVQGFSSLPITFTAA